MQEACGRGGDGEVTRGGAVAVVVEGERGLGQRRFLLGADEVVLVGVHHRLVRFDGLDRSPRHPAQLLGGEPPGLVHQHRLDRLRAARR